MKEIIKLIEAASITKMFNKLLAVNNLDLSIASGEIYGLVGSDGAGKTTTLRLLVGALRADSGKIRICGFNLLTQTEKAREKIGYLSQRFSMYEDLTVLENIRFFAEVRGLPSSEWKPRCLELLRFVGLENFTERKAGQLSGGMKQKLGLASALVTRPQVLLLDEPTTGVDPVTRQDFWQLIIRIVAEENMAVLLTTPYMDEAARCHRLGFMRSGSMIAEGSPSQLRGTLQTRIIELQTDQPIRMVDKVKHLAGVEDARPFGDKIHIRTSANRSAEVLQKLREGLSVTTDETVAVRFITPTLEDVFISLSSRDRNRGDLDE